MMRMLSVILFFVSVNEGMSAPSLCDSSEQVIFNCQIKTSRKLASLCSSKSMSDEKSGYLQYRFGRSGAVELEFPKEKKDSREKFCYSHYFRSEVDLTEICFESDGYQYILFDSYEGESEPVVTESGVRVIGPKSATLYCADAGEKNFGTIEQIIGCHDDGPTCAGDE